MLRFSFGACLLLLGTTACAQSPNSAVPKFSCSVNGHTVTVHLAGETTGERNPKNFGVSSQQSFSYLNDSSIPARFTNYDRSTRILKLDVRRQMAVRFKDGHPVREKAFPKPDQYQLIFADNLETETESTFSLECPVTIKAENLL